MNIKIQRLTLDNFKCFRHKEVTFDGDVTTISGRNGAGKTTIADAILWCFFGKNTQGQADFDLKTHDENGKPIPNLDHSVELCLLCGDSIVTLKRTLKETWVKKRGSDEQVFKNNTTEYLVNGDSYTAADYKKYIAQLVDEDVFKAITSPTYFPSLKWQVQREFLTKMAGDITPESSDVEFVDLLKQLTDNNEDIIAYRKHLSYQIKQIKDRLEKIPVRLEEQNKALPEHLDWDALQIELEQAQNGLKEIDEKIVAIKSGNGGDVLRSEIRVEIENIRRDMNDIEDKERIAYRTRQQEHDVKVMELSRKFNQLLNDQKDLESAVQTFGTLAKRCREASDKTFKEEQAEIRAKWPQTQAKFDVEKDGICPMCGQILPDEKLEKVKEMFNIQAANLKQHLTGRAAKAKELLAAAEQEAKDYEDKKAEAEQKLAETKEAINTTFAEKQKVEKKPVLTLEQALADDKEYQDYLSQKEELQKKLDSVGIDEVDEKQLSELQEKKQTLTEGIQTLTAQLATRDMRLKILALIDGINEEEKDLVRQLSELERKEDVARRYQDRQNQILEERINEHFSIVKWRMFRTVNNGGDPFDEPFCECYVDGVAYHDGLNQAARLNAGLDIINTLCKHYNVSAPIVLDNAESNLNILPTVGQQLRLQVADADLQIV